MLKKTATIIMAILLIFATSGITIYRHYCGVTLVKATVSFTPVQCCKIPCPMCHNETIRLKISDQYAASYIHHKFSKEVKALFTFPLFPQFVIISLSNLPPAHSQPIKVKPLFAGYFLAGRTMARLQVFLLWFSILSCDFIDPCRSIQGLRKFIIYYMV